MMRPVGGFLPLRLPVGVATARSLLSQCVGQHTQPWTLHNARSALHALWAATKPQRIWLPAYVCEEVATAVPAGVDVRFYPLDDALSPRIDVLSPQVRNGDHVLAVDYFGRPPSSDFVSLVRERPEVGWIEDRAHALDPADGAWGDWLLYSPRKLIGVPDGGILVARQKPLPFLTTVPPSDLAFVLPALERFEDRDETDNQRWYASYLHAEQTMRVGVQAMSRLTFEILNTADAHADAELRRGNYRVLHRRLREWAFLPGPDVPFAPLGFPVRVKSADALSRRLAELRIFAARHWRTLPSDPAVFASEHRLAKELLTLPCDYRYNEADMHRVADGVLASMAAGDA